jgi:UDP-glucose 4-epimerase
VRILITGGNGYVGRGLTRSLLDCGELLVIDNLRFGSVRFREDDLRRFHLSNIDIADAEGVRRVITEFDPEVIVHLAAIHYIPECNSDPVGATRANVSGTVNVLAACPDGCRFVFASSGAVYKPSLEPHRESSSAIEPDDIYGTTKLHGEHYVTYFSTQRGFPAVIVRLFNVVGPGETNPHVLPEIVAQLKAGRNTISLGQTENRRDFIHIDDAVSGFRTVALAKNGINSGPDIINLASGVSYSVDDMLRFLEEVRGASTRVERSSDRVRPSDRPVMRADIGQIRRLYGWQPEKTLRQAIADLWADPDLPPALMAKYAS